MKKFKFLMGLFFGLVVGCGNYFTKDDRCQLDSKIQEALAFDPCFVLRPRTLSSGLKLDFRKYCKSTTNVFEDENFNGIRVIKIRQNLEYWLNYKIVNPVEDALAEYKSTLTNRFIMLCLVSLLLPLGCTLWHQRVEGQTVASFLVWLLFNLLSFGQCYWSYSNYKQELSRSGKKPYPVWDQKFGKGFFALGKAAQEELVAKLSTRSFGSCVECVESEEYARFKFGQSQESQAQEDVIWLEFYTEKEDLKTLCEFINAFLQKFEFVINQKKLIPMMKRKEEEARLRLKAEKEEARRRHERAIERQNEEKLQLERQRLLIEGQRLNVENQRKSLSEEQLSEQREKERRQQNNSASSATSNDQANQFNNNYRPGSNN